MNSDTNEINSMNNEEPLTESIVDTKTERPLVIKIICIAGLIISLLEIAGSFYATQINGSGYENEWTIYLKVIPFVNILCWVGFWTLRKATLILYCLNILFSLWVHYHIGVSLFDLYTCLYIFVAVVIFGQLHKMTKYI